MNGVFSRKPSLFLKCVGQAADFLWILPTIADDNRQSSIPLIPSSSGQGFRLRLGLQVLLYHTSGYLSMPFSCATMGQRWS
jgi:hypothetical protein